MTSASASTSTSTLFISIIVSLLIACMCAATAPFKDRDEERYGRPTQFLAGLFFGILICMIFFVLPELSNINKRDISSFVQQKF